MNQIYHFDIAEPPALDEAKLRAALLAREIQRQACMLAVGGALLLFALLLAVVALFPLYPIAALGCAAYGCMMMSGSGLVAFVFVKRRRAYE